MDKVARKMYTERFKEEYACISSLKHFDTLDEAADELLRLCRVDAEYLSCEVWRTPNTDAKKYTIVKPIDFQTALNLGYKLILNGGYANEVVDGRWNKRDYPYEGNGYDDCDGTKTYIYKKYRELGLL